MKVKKRLDVLLTEQGYADSRSKAQSIITSSAASQAAAFRAMQTIGLPMLRAATENSALLIIHQKARKMKFISVLQTDLHFQLEFLRIKLHLQG